jgi:hypothetical protein
MKQYQLRLRQITAEATENLPTTLNNGWMLAQGRAARFRASGPAYFLAGVTHAVKRQTTQIAPLDAARTAVAAPLA